MTNTLAGKCFCGAVAYAVADEFRLRHELPLLELPADDGIGLQAVRRHRARQAPPHPGPGRALIYGDDKANDTHCRRCGSLLYSVVRDGAFVHVAMGTLVDDPSIRPSRHIFVGSKAPWFTITDDLPQYAEHVTAAGPTGG